MKKASGDRNREPDKTRKPTPDSRLLIASPWPAQGDVAKFFGRIDTGGDGMPTARWESAMLTMIQLPYPMRLAWDTDVVVTRTRCHQAVARDLTTILGEIHAFYGRDMAAIRAARMDLYGGCYNYRAKRGGASLSMHSYGIAIDLDPDRNGRGRPWKAGAGMMPEAVVDIFLRHGWTWGGLWHGGDSDPMHFQATQPL